MSFSKAKIIRFNDTTRKLNEGIPKKVSTSPGSDTNSVKSVPATFRTPTLPKKIKTATPATKIKPKELFSCDLKALQQKTTECENKTKYIHKLTEELEDLKKQLSKLKEEKEQLHSEKQKEIEDLEFEMLKIMNELHRQEQEATIKMKYLQDKLENEINNLKKVHEFEIGQVVLDCEIKLKEIREASEKDLQDKLNALEQIWRKKFQDKEQESEEILKECQAISEYSIIQCELEKKTVQKCLDELTLEYDVLYQKYTNLSCKLNNCDEMNLTVEKKLEEQINALTDLIIEKEDEVSKLTAEIKMFQMTINNSQTAIEVLTNRLIHSDRDVELLKSDLSRCENEILEYESKCYQLQTELVEAKNYHDDLELQFEAALKLNESSISNIRNELLAKVEFYESEVKKFTRKETEEQLMKYSIVEELNYNIDVVKKIKKEVEKTEEIYSLEIEDLKKTVELCLEKEKSYLMSIDALTEENFNLKNNALKHENKIEELERKLLDKQEQNEKLTEKYDYYKSKSEEFETDSIESSEMRKKYIDLSGKFDLLLQDFEASDKNNTEYRKEIDQLMEKLDKLLIIEEKYEKVKKEKSILETENQTFKSKLEDQKVKKYKFAMKDKENIGSPNRSLIDSPNRGSPFRSSPFKERN